MAPWIGIGMAVPGMVIGGFWWGVLRIPRRVGKAQYSTKWLASVSEEVAFRILEDQYPVQGHIISAHMLLADVIGRPQLRYVSTSWREFCWKAHCDFVIVDRASLKVLRVVEVNGSYHRQHQQSLRDAKKRAILHQFGIELEIWEAHRGAKVT